jgi:translation initiation factor 1
MPDPFHNPFGALSALRDRLPASEASTAAEAAKPGPASADAAPPPRAIARAVVRYERAGRGGKAVTVIEQLGLNPDAREAWLKALKAALGCGGAIEGDDILLQGDHRQRLPALLAGRGVKKVTVGQ